MIAGQSARADSSTQVDQQQHAFDFHFGTRRTQILRRSASESGAGKWARMTGVIVDEPLWSWRANLEKIEASGAGGHLQGLTLFLYDPKSGQWSQQVASSSEGIMQEPVYGQFKNGRGVLYGWSGSGGRKILERDVWSNIEPNSYHFEIASSVDGGKTWVTSFIAQLTRLRKDLDHSAPHARSSGPEQGFDFNMGSWKTQIRAVLEPLSAPNAWSNLQGTHVVYRIWDDWANIGQLEVDIPGGHNEDLALRLYDRKTRQWRVYFANSKSEILDPPMIGEFKGGVGTFIGWDDEDGKAVLSRNIWSGITARSCHQNWAISSDGGKTWIPTRISTDTRGT